MVRDAAPYWIISRVRTAHLEDTTVNLCFVMIAELGIFLSGKWCAIRRPPGELGRVRTAHLEDTTVNLCFVMMAELGIFLSGKWCEMRHPTG